MANPQKENGHTGIANELLEELISFNLNGTELALVLLVLRKTYGYNKKEDWISYTQFEKCLNRQRPNIWKAIKSLVTKKILVTKKQLLKTLYSINKDYSQWVVTKKQLVTKKKQGSYEKEIKVVTKKQPTKEIITKENIQKELGKIILHWNDFKNADSFWVGTRKITDELIDCYRKIRGEEYDVFVENWNYALEKYCDEIKNRTEGTSYFKHRFSLLEFIKQKNGYTKFLNIK